MKREEIKETNDQLPPADKLTWYDIVNWRHPPTTFAVLFALNLGLVAFNYLQLTVISFVFRKFLLFAFFQIIKQQLLGKSQDESEMFTKNKVEKLYYTLYNKINTSLDKLRKIILLQEIPSLIRLVVTLLFVITFASYFSSFTCLFLACDIAILLNYGEIRNQVRNYSNIAIEVTSKMINDLVPKYKEEIK